jgi:hypothetical protein
MKALVLTLMIAALPVHGADVVEASGAKLRVLDKLTGVVSDYDLAAGQRQVEGRLTVQLDECRYPAELPNGEAYAHLTISDSDQPAPVFHGWMIASSPALSALDHPRYDVWVLRCDVPETTAPATDSSPDTAAPGAPDPAD